MVAEPLRGRCPACGDESLARGFQGSIGCTNTLCTDRQAVDTLLNDPHLTDHLLRVYHDERWTLRHPLIERVNDALFECVVQLFVADRARLMNVGLYRVTGEAPDYEFELVEETDHADT